MYLKDERGNGQPYTLPAHVHNAKKEAGEEITRDEYWVQLPASFWIKGWIAVLSAPAVAMLLVMLDEAAGKLSASGTHRARPLSASRCPPTPAPTGSLSSRRTVSWIRGEPRSLLECSTSSGCEMSMISTLSN